MSLFTGRKSDSLNKVVFCLARGYSGIRILKYFKLCVRNICAASAIGEDRKLYHFIIFHEGNITAMQQRMIKLFSLNPRLFFVDVASEFKVSSDLYPPRNEPGYVYMCRFSYFGVWRYLERYRIAMRIDDDVFLLSLKNSNLVSVFDYAFISNETHEATNRSLVKFLADRGIENLYDHKFPYTNFYVTDPQFWLRREVQDFLLEVYQMQVGLDDRWGDATVLGVALKHFGVWDGTNLREDVTYLHLSHKSIVNSGVNSSVYSVIRKSFPKLAKSLRFFYYLFK
jgi:hypothetical protein